MGKDNCTYLLPGFVLNSSRTRCCTWSSQATQTTNCETFTNAVYSHTFKKQTEQTALVMLPGDYSRQLHFLTQEVSDRKLRFGVVSIDSYDGAFLGGCRGGSEVGSHKGCQHKAYILRATAFAWEVPFQDSIRVSARKCAFQDTCISTQYLANLYLTVTDWSPTLLRFMPGSLFILENPSTKGLQ